MVREYVATRRRQIRVEAGREPANTFIPQEHLPGREAEVDFGEVAIRLLGELVTCTLFSLRMSYSGKAVHRISALSAGALTSDAVALEARKHDDETEGQAIGADTAQPASPEVPPVRSLTERRLRAQLPADDRPLPTVDKYDQLLSSHRENPSEGAAP